MCVGSNHPRPDERRLPENDPGIAMMRLAEELFPICRSITGNGLRQSLAILGQYIPLTLSEVASGTSVLDWKVPPEWNIYGAYVAGLDGARVIDFANNNLHIVQYSIAVDAIVPLEELRRHLHTLPEQPDWIPYRTSYYHETWGFCLSHGQLATITDPSYRVVINSSLTTGHLTYGECVVSGKSEQEVLFSCHICHPSLANDNLSGIVVATMLARHLLKMRPRYTYRFLFIPGTIGSLTWLARNEEKVNLITHGLVLSCLGDAGGVTYKQSRRGNAAIDRIAAHVLKHDPIPHRIVPFVPYGYDERQYCSPGFDLPVGCFMRTPNGEYPEYHSSADNLALLRPESLAHSLGVLQRIVEVIEGDAIYRSRNAKGEPALGRRGLWAPKSSPPSTDSDLMALLWVLNLADGQHSLVDTAEQCGLPFASVRAAADALLHAELLHPAV
jgi:aminopeptidase-like protein